MNVKVKQHDGTDCGVACLASVAAHYKLGLPISRIRQLAHTDQMGTNALGLIEAAEQMGFTAKGVRASFEALYELPMPAIAHVLHKGGIRHFVVIYKVTKRYIMVMDPGDGQMHRKTHEQLQGEWTGVLILLQPTTGFTGRDHRVPAARRFWDLVQPHKNVMLQAFVGAVIYTVLGLSTSVYIQKIVDNVLIAGNRNLLNLLGVAMILILLFQLFIGSVKTVFALKTGQRIDVQLILGYYKHLLTLPQRFFDTMRVGEIVSRINDAVKIRVFINEAALNMVVNFFIVVFSFLLMFTYYWKLALIMLMVIPVYILIYLVVNSVNKKLQRKIMENSADLEAQLVESLNAVGTIRRFGVERYANLRTESRFIRLLHKVYRSGICTLYGGNATELASRLFTIILLWSGAGFVIDQSITAGELLSFYTLVGYFTGPAANLIGMNKTIQDALIAADRLYEIMDLEREETADKMELTRDMIGDIHFRNVSFRYGSRGMIFEQLNMVIPMGEITGVVGESGSGKSTLISLLQNLYPLKGGQITIGKYDTQHISNRSLRAVISVVPQQIDLFSGNVRDNIALGEHTPDMKRILDISESLGIVEFVEKLPEGFNTYIGENGVSLSGGQRQRLAIARALYKEPEIIILDEATSSLDSVSERYVQDTLRSLRAKGKTIIVIAHRLSTVKSADKIVVMANGSVVEEGTHQELLARRQSYHHLWEQQFIV